jgi:hypothetical protein
MLYSTILTDYHRIGLNSIDCMAIDSHFTAHAHHIYRAVECNAGTKDADFHRELARLHARALLTIIYERGDFIRAIDPTGEERNQRSWWVPEWSEIPEGDLAEMFPDWRYRLGHYHPHDILVTAYVLRKAG